MEISTHTHTHGLFAININNTRCVSRKYFACIQFNQLFYFIYFFFLRILKAWCQLTYTYYTLLSTPMYIWNASRCVFVLNLWQSCHFLNQNFKLDVCVWFLLRAIRESKQNTERPHFEWHMRAFETVCSGAHLCTLKMSFYANYRWVFIGRKNAARFTSKLLLFTFIVQFTREMDTEI